MKLPLDSYRRSTPPHPDTPVGLGVMADDGPMDFLNEPEPVRICILGSTGSIGRQALDVVRANPERFVVTALSAGSDVKTLGAQAAEFKPSLIGIGTGTVETSTAQVFSGPDAAAKLAEESEAEVVLNAVVGAAGLTASLATLKSGKVLALANKESLVAAGELVMGKAGPGQIRPVDSEHSALWQVLEGIPQHQVRRVILTGSGGPFRGRKADDLRNVAVEDALAHPVWDMGRKISVDSATLMNKGLEVIEAHFLFGFTYDEIDVVIHPQGLIHAMAETIDGATFAHAAPPDMKLPIQIALSWPERFPKGIQPISWDTVDAMTFEKPDRQTFRCLELGYEAGRQGDTYPAALNASNEVAVEGFLNKTVEFTDIPGVIQSVLDAHEPIEATLEGVMEADGWARQHARNLIDSKVSK